MTRIPFPAIVLVVALLLTTRAVAQETSPPAPVAPRLQTRTLANGLKVLVREDHSLPLVALDLWVRAGSASEREGEHGAVHLLEHLLFKKGDEAAASVDEEIENLGASLEAGTSKDWCHFYTTVPAASAEAALRVLARMVANPTLDAEAVAKEQGVVIQEILRALSDPLRAMATRVTADAFGSHPYGRPASGMPQDLARLSPAVLRSVHERLFAPSNLALVIVGDWEASRALDAAAAAFGTLPSRPKAALTAPTPSWNPRPDPDQVRYRSERSHYVIAFPGPSFTEREDVLAMDVITALLDQGPRGRLERALAEIGITARIDVGFLTSRWPGILTIGASMPNEHLKASVETITHVLRELSEADVPSEELAQARSRLVSSYIFDTETFGGQAYSLGFYEALGDVAFSDGYVAGVGKVTAAEVRRVARKYLDPSQSVSLLASPPEEDAAPADTQEEASGV